MSSKEYGFLYLPPFVYGYLYSFTEPVMWNLRFISLSSHKLYFYSIFLTVIGSLLFHKLFLLIFGEGGPSKNPKWSVVAIFYSVSFVTAVGIEEIFDGRKIENWIDFTDAISDNLNRWRILQIVLLVIPMGFTFLSFYIGAILLYLYVKTGTDVDIVGLGLFIGMLIFIFQSRVWNWFPNYANTENVENVLRPEYLIYLEKLENQNFTEPESLEDWLAGDTTDK